MFTDFCISFGIYMILIEGPNFIDNILHKDILQVGDPSILLHSSYNTYFDMI